MDSIFKNDHNTVSFEVLIVENNSTTSEIFEYYQQLQEQHSEVGVLIWDKAWNYSALNNFAARAATGEYLLFK